MSAAASMFLAAFAGAFVARANFLVPAVVIAVAVWFLAASFMEAVIPQFNQGNTIFYWVTNVGGAFLAVGSGMMGAHFGRRFSKRNAVNDSNAA
jgi:hypothetical protein